MSLKDFMGPWGVVYPFTLEGMMVQIRMKHNHQHVVTADRREGANFYQWESRGPVDGTLLLHAANEWEEVPEKQWRRVEVDILDGHVGPSSVLRAAGCIYHLPNHYRFSRGLGYSLFVEKLVDIL